MTIAEKLYGSKRVTSIENARQEKYFRARVARHNKKAERKLHRTFRSKAKKWRRYYGHSTGGAKFTFYADADPEKVAKKATLLQQLGAEVEFEESDE